ncbi:hypothetical protein [Desulfosporosinus metallidurans]|uniref:Uncharacterized protein n=1 Tax=Desulfosporosinus metallidurans TaxID=1888891 RepID=A0A1Q8QSJ5_9FIRM|nr:hypothetical protein [Desulfosporosinus metallidurans]OLN30325.1 hypothetical protein DSOL_3090 [Desulfosporosinus metallidurans]
MKQKKWEMVLGLVLGVFSLAIYIIQDLIFHDAQIILSDLLLQIAFLPIYIFLSTIVIDSLLSRREKGQRVRKLNMVIGAFFSETGLELLQALSKFDKTSEETIRIILRDDWPHKSERMKKWVGKDGFQINSRVGELEGLKMLLLKKRDFLLRMLENPNLLEHETFTELLWAVFHLSEELASRADLSHLSEADYYHFSGDIKRAYSLLILEWLTYMIHLKEDYPFLFSFAARTNPFDPEARAEISE